MSVFPLPFVEQTMNDATTKLLIHLPTITSKQTNTKKKKMKKYCVHSAGNRTPLKFQIRNQQVRQVRNIQGTCLFFCFGRKYAYGIAAEQASGRELLCNHQLLCAPSSISGINHGDPPHSR
jgi:hypothetical protein